MHTTLNINGKTLTTDLNQPMDLSIPLRADKENPIAWYLDKPEIFPVKDGDWVAKVSEGASVNFNSIYFNPHAHGTHTECFGHISKDFHSVNGVLERNFFTAKLISLQPEQQGGDAVFTQKMLQQNLEKNETEAVLTVFPMMSQN